MHNTSLWRSAETKVSRNRKKTSAFDSPLVTKAFPLSPVWTTTRCAVTTEKLTGVAMVCVTSADYNKTFLYSLALAEEVDPGGSAYQTSRLKSPSRWRIYGRKAAWRRDDLTLEATRDWF